MMTLNMWIVYVAGGIFLMLAGVLAALLLINANQRAELATARGDLVLLRAANAEWAERTAATNAAIEKIRADDTARTKKVAKARRATREATRTLREQAEKIATFKIAGDECADADALRRFYLERMR